MPRNYEDDEDCEVCNGTGYICESCSCPDGQCRCVDGPYLVRCPDC